MGVVFKAFDIELHRPVAVKVLAPHLAGNGSARQRFAREARAAAAVVHEHDVAIHNVETDGTAPFLVMEYVAGESLQQLTDDPNNLETFKSIVRDAFQARQQLERAELRAFVNRVKDLEQSIEARERITQQIVNRRVKELLDPNLKWENATSDLQQAPAIPTSQPPKSINNKEVTFQLVGMPERWQTHLQWLSGQGAITTNATGSHIRTSLGAKLQFRAPLSPQLVGTARFIGIELLDPEPEKLANFHSIVKANPIPLALTLDDFEEARSGKLVTKVIYLSKDLSKSLFNSLSTREIDAGVDPIERAKELGIPIAIVRISDRQAP